MSRRVSKANKKETRFSVALSPKERRFIQRASRLARTRPSTWVRRVALAKAATIIDRASR